MNGNEKKPKEEFKPLNRLDPPAKWTDGLGMEITCFVLAFGFVVALFFAGVWLLRTAAAFIP